MDIFQIGSFLVVAIAATFSPGPAVILAISNAANFGFKQSLIGIAGNVFAMLIYASLASLGIGYIIQNFGAFTLVLIQFSGGCYLIFLGYKLIRSRANISNNKNTYPGAISLFTTAFSVGLSNPKAIVFFSALFPQFIDYNEEVLSQSILLMSIFALCSFSALVCYSLISDSIFKNRKGDILNTVNIVSGFIYIAIGIGLAFSSSKNGVSG